MSAVPDDDLTDHCYTAKQAAKVLKVHVHKLYALVREGSLVATRITPHSIRITRSELARFLNDGPKAN